MRESWANFKDQSEESTHAFSIAEKLGPLVVDDKRECSDYVSCSGVPL